jgi:hypothetical protein
MPSGYAMSGGNDYDSGGLRELANLAAETGSIVSLRDSRGSVTPEYIQKVQRERYY